VVVQVVNVSSTYSVGLVQAVGVSSSFIAQQTRGATNFEELASVERFDYWNQWDYKGE
jgi:hypothetical protein